jgi:hypothetical protein
MELQKKLAKKSAKELFFLVFIIFMLILSFSAGAYVAHRSSVERAENYCGFMEWYKENYEQIRLLSQPEWQRVNITDLID